MLSASVADSPAVAAAAPRALPIAPLTYLLSELAASNYSFITPTPVTHQRVLAHRAQQRLLSESARQPAAMLRDIFGWNFPFEAAAVRPHVLALMGDTGILRCRGDLFSSAVCVSSIDDDLFVHSACPTGQGNAVFFGPDTYRFARFIQQVMALTHSWRVGAGRALGRPLRILDARCGSGACGLVAARCLKNLSVPFSVLMNDSNPLALHYTAINAAFAGIPVNLSGGSTVAAVAGTFDLIVANAPYLNDVSTQAYQHDCAGLGRALSVRIAAEALGRLAPGGQLLLYTGVAMVDGVDRFIADMLPLLARTDCDWSYAEIDPDVFGEELGQPAYAHVDRIAAVGLVATRHRAVC